MAIYRRAGRPGVFGGVAALLLCAMLTVLVAGSARAAITYTDLYTLGTPAGFDSAGPSGFIRAAGGQVVGVGSGPATGNINYHALLWTPSATSGIDLNPTGFTSSQTNSTSGTQQVGLGSGPRTGNNLHALLWSGSAGRP